MSGTSVRPLQLDGFFAAEKAPLRAAKFTEPDWTEEAVWAEPPAA